MNRRLSRRVKKLETRQGIGACPVSQVVTDEAELERCTCRPPYGHLLVPPRMTGEEWVARYGVFKSSG